MAPPELVEVHLCRGPKGVTFADHGASLGESQLPTARAKAESYAACHGLGLVELTFGGVATTCYDHANPGHLIPPTRWGRKLWDYSAWYLATYERTGLAKPPARDAV